MTKTREQLVIVDTVQTAGCVSYWRIASDTSLDKLTVAWKKHGLAEDQLPEPPKDEVALGRAVNAQAEKRRLVRPLARRGAWAVVEETVTEQEEKAASGYPAAHTKPVTYRTLVTVRHQEVPGPTLQPVVLQVEGTDMEWAQLSASIKSAYTSARATLAHVDVSSWLLDIAYKKLGAVSLRDSGGVYFIPRANVDIWNKVAAAVEEAGSSIFRIPAMRTAEAVAAITDAITAEAAAESQKIENELEMSGDVALGARALKTRVNDLEALLAKLNTYEELVGQQLAIRERVTSLRANASAAILTLMNEEAA